MLPNSQVWKITNTLHKSTHFERHNLETLLKPILYHPQLAKVVQQLTQNCDTCQGNNPKARPCHLLQLNLSNIGDNTQERTGRQILQPCQRPKCSFFFCWGVRAFFFLSFSYLLLFIDMLTGWIETFPTRIERATKVCKTLLKEIVPKFGLT